MKRKSQTANQNSKAKPVNYPKNSKNKKINDDIPKTIKNENHQIRYEFLPDEITQKSRQLADAVQDRNSIVDEKKEAMSMFQSKIDAKTSEINILSKQISNGHELKTVLCEVIRNFTKGVREYWWDSKFYDSEKLTAADHQIELDLSEKNNKAEQKDLDLE